MYACRYVDVCTYVYKCVHMWVYIFRERDTQLYVYACISPAYFLSGALDQETSMPSCQASAIMTIPAFPLIGA